MKGAAYWMVNIKNWLVYKILREIKGWIVANFFEPFIILASRIKGVIEEHFWDKRLGIITGGRSPVKHEATLYKDSSIYAPTAYNVIEKMLDYLQFSPDDVFIDLGCGKGRVIFFIATKRLKKVIGVEVRKDMVEIAMENLRNLKLKNTPVEIVNTDAATFDMREGTVFFMFSPFGRRTHTKVIANIRNSFAVNPRKVRIAYYGGGFDHNASPDYDWLEHKENITNIHLDIWQSK